MDIKYSRIAALARSRNAFFHTRSTSLLPVTRGKELGLTAIMQQRPCALYHTALNLVNSPPIGAAFLFFRRSDGRPDGGMSGRKCPPKKTERKCKPSPGRGRRAASQTARPSAGTEKINNQVRESERRTAQHIRARSYSRVRPPNPWRNKRDPHQPKAG